MASAACLVPLVCLALLGLSAGESPPEITPTPPPPEPTPTPAPEEPLSTTVATNVYQPEQIRLSYPNNPTQMTVTWVTKEDVDTGSMVVYRLATENATSTALATSKHHVSGSRTQVIHRAIMTGLTPGATYVYAMGSIDGGWSDLHAFTAMKSGSNWKTRLAVFGDMGVENAQIMNRLKLDTMSGMYDAVLHVGDIAYDLHHEDGQKGDRFLRMVEPVAARVPYMVCPGNHEHHANFSEYKARFSMPGDAENMFYTMEMGPVQFISISTDFYYYLDAGSQMAINQYNWLKKVLQAANVHERRAERPWLVIYGHHPMYCSHFTDDEDCLNANNRLRVGIPELNIPGIEPLLYQYGVDIAIWGHIHAYERLWPVFNTQVYNGTAGEPYTNPGAPVHITTGTGGTDYRGGPIVAPPSFSAYQNSDYGYARLTFHNASHVTIEQVSTDQGGTVIDSVVVKKSAHGPYDQL